MPTFAILMLWLCQISSMQNVLILCRVDVATLMAPYQAVGREVRVYWPDEDAWFLGSVTSFDPVTARHEVPYSPHAVLTKQSTRFASYCFVWE